ncbi:MAG: cellulase family glycosylhydrolase [Bacteroidia bacterium]
MCQSHNLKAIVDLHILRSHHFNEGENRFGRNLRRRNTFSRCWRELSAELINYPNDFLAYELMNEPVADNPDDWNVLVGKAAAVVRENEPYRKIFIGSNRWQSTETFGDLRLPENDKHIIVSFHFYEPFLLTHHTASWTGIKLQRPGAISRFADSSGSDGYPECGGESFCRADESHFHQRQSGKRIMKPVNYARERGYRCIGGNGVVFPQCLESHFSTGTAICGKCWKPMAYPGQPGIIKADLG